MNFRKLAGLAIDVAHSVSITPGAPHTNAYVPWSLIIEIREECDRLGILWRETHPRATKPKDTADE